MSKRRRGRRAKPRFWLLLSLLLMLALGATAMFTISKLNSLEARAEARGARLSELMTIKSEKQGELNYVLTDEYAERAARDKLGFMYPSEIRYVGD